MRSRCNIILIGITGMALAVANARDFTVRLQSRTDETGAAIPVTRPQMDLATATIGKRLKALDLGKPEITTTGDDRFIVKTGDITPAQAKQVIAAIETPGNFELREVSPINHEVGSDGKSLAQRVLEGSEIVPGYVAISYVFIDGEGKETQRPLLVNRRAALNSSDIATAEASPPQTNTVLIAAKSGLDAALSVSPPHREPGTLMITLNEVGADKMIALTQNMRPGIGRIAILLNGQLNCAPVVNQVPLGKNFIIDGLKKPGEAKNLAIALTNPLETPLVVEK